jgi:hypothetical protein
MVTRTHLIVILHIHCVSGLLKGGEVGDSSVWLMWRVIRCGITEFDLPSARDCSEYM